MLNEKLHGCSSIRIQHFAEKPIVGGVGIVSPSGLHPDAVVDAVVDNCSVFESPAFSSDHFSDRRVALVRNYEARNYINPPRAARYMSRETQFAVAALGLCIDDFTKRSGAALFSWIDPYDIALFAGTGSSGISLDDIMPMLINSCDPQSGRFDPVRFSSRGLSKLNPLTSFRILPNMPPSVAVIYGGVKGENLIFNPWEGSAMSGFQEAIHALTEGRSRLAISGGSDCKTHSDAFIAFDEYGLFSRGPFVMSEGSAYLAMYLEESELTAIINPYCRVAGMASMTVYGDTISAPMSSEMCEGIMMGALSSARLSSDEIDCVISSEDFGFQDLEEHEALNAIFREAGEGKGSTIDNRLPRIIHPRKVFGNAVASAGHFSLSLGAAVLDSADERAAGMERIMVNSFGFGSEKHCVILEKP
ncbi:MAG: hypothetical protein CVV64_00100 [Candidatus Wallbacteria bacterium HGW-Wallbacteria-1]|jgi:3-oxoacyl-(acyl-carrier-protein) synthase|uniref:Beta-ketoacyl synthase-like N-terminal domain-containing protein n=1 Tax=Candidatus Wallbacteria bacterium HGW-Wallbacteria-1 TaxID=2013854 RepID=A0A2N1PU39_9BACT|nr:MAG: hypothetical protein CVV64_00100 [Candidatus Wallbacteria bacterium HGW-Wallbacteria-1]